MTSARNARLLGVLAIVSAIVILLPFASSSSQTKNVASSPSGDEIIQFVDQTVVWYQQFKSQQQLASTGNEVPFFNDNRQIAEQIVRLSFDFGRARAQALSRQRSSDLSSAAVAATPQYQRLSEMAGEADSQVQKSRQELEQLRQRLNDAAGRKRQTLEAMVAETESELQLFQARRDAIGGMLQATSARTSDGQSAGTLSEQIDELARTVPVAAAATKEPGMDNSSSSSSTIPMAVASREQLAGPTGIIAQISNLFSLRHKIVLLDDNIRITDSLAQSAKSLRSPLGTKIRELMQEGNAIAAQPDSTDLAILGQQSKELNELTSQYKQLSASLLPLGKQSILLDVYKRSVVNWRNALEMEYRAEIKGLVLRFGGLALILGALLGLSEVWRRATFRYVTDTRRRRQFLLLRRIVVWCVIAIIVAVAFASELGAITTFAGLLTAGIALALQNVVLSVAGYFFLIGKYGLRVGDRVQVAGITGDVIDIGLVRLHLIEVAGGTGPRPTGRVVAFANSVVFQANAGLFKQIPGTNFVWHEVKIALGPESDYAQVEKRILDVVSKVLARYHDRMEVQRRNMESAYSVPGGSFDPDSRLHMTTSGLELVIRYPVELNNAAEIDDRITREVIETIGHEPKLRLVGTQVEAQPA